MKVEKELNSAPIIRSAPYQRPQVRTLTRRRGSMVGVARASADVVAVSVGLFLATVIRFGEITLSSHGPYGSWLAVWGVFWCLGFPAAGAYDRHRIASPADELRRMARGVGIGGLLVFATSFWMGFHLSRLWALYALASVGALTLAARIGVRKGLHVAYRRGARRRRVIIIGSDASGAELARRLVDAPWEGMQVVEVLPLDRPTLSGLWKRVADEDIDEVLLAPSVVASGQLDAVVASLDGVPVALRIAVGIEGFLTSRLVLHPLAGSTAVAVERAELKLAARAVKRAMDITVSLVGLVVVLPVIAICALAVRINTKGPIIFRQERVGRAGREFTLFKLRTMVADAELRRAEVLGSNEADGLLFKLEHDPRVTSVGRWLRATSLDELPQLINVLKGDMSLVGPRPPLPEEVARYDARIGRRLLVKPGITGLWQVNGRHELSFDDYVRYDLLYVQNWSVALDLYCIIKTLPAMINRRGAY